MAQARLWPQRSIVAVGGEARGAALVATLPAARHVLDTPEVMAKHRRIAFVVT